MVVHRRRRRTGYSGSVFLPQIADALLVRDPITRSLDPPLWTLHYEFWGLMLVFLLAFVHRRLPLPAHLGLAVIVALTLSRYPLLPFVVGNMFAVALRSGRWPAVPSLRWQALGALALAAGLWSCTNRAWHWVTLLSQASDQLLMLGDAHL